MSAIRNREEVKPKPSDAIVDTEEAADERAWETQFAATPDDKLNKLIEQVQAKIQAGKVAQMDFTEK